MQKLELVFQMFLDLWQSPWDPTAPRSDKITFLQRPYQQANKETTAYLGDCFINASRTGTTQT